MKQCQGFIFPSGEPLSFNPHEFAQCLWLFPLKDLLSRYLMAHSPGSFNLQCKIALLSKLQPPPWEERPCLRAHTHTPYCPSLLFS